jgi:hypothetical protein
MLSGAIGPRVCDDQRGAGGETPPFQNAKGGGIRRAVVRSPAVTVARHAQARPPPLVPVWVPTTDAATLLFLPPALRLVHPALYLIFVLLTPARNSASLLTAPPSLSSPWRQQRRRPAQRRSHEGTIAGGRQAVGYPVRVVVVPATQGGGGGDGAEHSALLLPGSRSRSVRRWFPCRRHRRWGLGGGGAPAAAVAGRGGSGGSGSGRGMWS